MRFRGRIAVCVRAALVLCIVVFAGCGGAFRGGDRGTTPGSTRAEPVGGERVVVCFLKGEAPVSVVRQVGKAGAEVALEELLKGPTAQERAEGLSTMIPDGTRLRSFSVEGDRAKLDFSERLLAYGGGSAAVAAITGQITRTVLGNDERLRGVTITIEGVPAEEVMQP